MRKIFIMVIVLYFICAISFGQNVGIGTNSPKARLHVADSSVVFTGLNDNILYPAIPPPVQGPGIRMLWYPEKAAFRAGFAGFNTWDRDNIGTHSFAGGQGTLAKGASTVAFGLATEAIGAFSTATGIYTRTRAYGSIVVGAYNNSTDNPNPIAMMPEDRIFQIGNGSGDNARSNAVTVLRNGNVGIGTTEPSAKLHVADSSVLFTGNISEPETTTNVNPPTQGQGTRMFWFPALGAFRAGYVDGLQWDKDSIGQLSIAAGSNTKAKGRYSVAFGYNTMASGDHSFASGWYSTASGVYSTALGNATKAIGIASTALGQGATASGRHSIAVGFYPIASGFASVGMNDNTNASGYSSTAMGGFTIASGSYSVAMGEYSISKSHGGTVIGVFNDDADNPNPIYDASSDRIFQIGNGDFNQRSNALTVLRNGNIGLGTTMPNAQLQFPNDINQRKLVLYETANNNHQFYGFGVTSSVLRYQTATTGDDHVFYAGTSTTTSQELMRLRGVGFLGIGNYPEFRLDVSGRMRVRSGGDANNSAGIVFNNNNNSALQSFLGARADDEFGVYGYTGTAGWRFYVNTTTGNAFLQGVLTQNSDARLKKDIVPLSNTLDAILQLNGYSYNWKDASNPEEQIGLLAQEIQKVYPQLVKENEGGVLSVNYSGMVPVLLEAIKEQQSEIAELKKIVSQLIKQSK